MHMPISHLAICAGCSDAYDDGRMDKPRVEFKNCLDEIVGHSGMACSGALLIGCAKTCGGCVPVSEVGVWRI